jgi:hypothetical protein
MATETAVKPTATQNGKALAWEGGNIYQRINAALVEMGDLTTDKVHPHHKYPYVSVQKLLASWRHVSIKYGIRTSMSFEQDDTLWVSLINMDNPEDREVSKWPISPDDKGWSYTAKYALMKILMVADDEEPDERTVQTAPSTPPRRAAATAPVQRREAAPPDPETWKPVSPVPEPEDPFVAKVREAKAQLDSAAGGDALVRNAFNVDGLRGCIAPLAGGAWGVRPDELKKLTPPLRDSALARLYEAIAQQTEPLREPDGSVSPEPVPL